jgi:hypothetical protein
MRRLPIGFMAFLLMVCLGLPRSALAQLAVEDLGVLGQMLTSVAALAELVGLSTDDLQALASMGPVMAMADQVVVLSSQLRAIGAQVTAFSDGWVQMGSAELCSEREIASWLSQAIPFAREGSRRVLQIHAVLWQLDQALTTMTQIVLLIPLIGGSTSGLQVNAALLSVTQSELRRLQGVMTPYAQLMIADTLIDQVVGVGSLCAAPKRMHGFGVY